MVGAPVRQAFPGKRTDILKARPLPRSNNPQRYGSSPETIIKLRPCQDFPYKRTVTFRDRRTGPAAKIQKVTVP
jgi:hypothetical protein